jgi:hypothetical protein
MERRLCEPLNSTMKLFVGSMKLHPTSCRVRLLIVELGNGDVSIPQPRHACPVRVPIVEQCDIGSRHLVN